MRHPAIEPLLILQDREQTHRSLSQKLNAIPAEAAAVQGRIDAEQRAIESARTEWRELETKKKMLETEIGSAEDKLAKYRTQQSLVKKNDEYQALGHEIESTEAKVGALEEQELELMYEIDAAKERFAAAEGVAKTHIDGHRRELASLAERETSLRAEQVEAAAAVSAARTPVDDRVRTLFDRIAARQFPVCVPVERGKCTGCHLKVSGEVESVARRDEALATCDQCGRIVWWESV